MSLYKPKRSPYWWINLPNPHGGQRIRESTKQIEKRSAQRIHDEKKAELWTVKTTGHQFYDAVSQWLKAKPRSINRINEAKQIYLKYKNRPLGQVTGESVLAVFGDKKPGTYNKLANIIRASLNLAKELRWIDAVDKIPRKKEPKGKITFLTRQQFENLYSKLAEHQKPLFLFALSTGLRWSNVTNLEWSRVDIKRKIAWIDAEDMKGGENHPVPLSDDAIAVLNGQSGIDATWVFPYRGLPITSPKTAFNRARNEVGLEKFRWHDIRHTWASWHVMSGTPLEVLQKLGAWKDAEMVQRYAHLDPGYVARFADNAKPYETNVVEIKKRKKA